MDIIPINKTKTKESKQTKTKRLFVMAPDFTRLSIEVIEYARFQNNYSGMITVSLDVRTVTVFVFTAI